MESGMVSGGLWRRPEAAKRENSMCRGKRRCVRRAAGIVLLGLACAGIISSCGVSGRPAEHANQNVSNREENTDLSAADGEEGADHVAPGRDESTDLASDDRTESSFLVDQNAVEWEDMHKNGEMTLSYATQFTVDYYDNNYKLITIAQNNRYLVVPEGAPVPAGLPEDVAVLRQPLTDIYLAATSAMDLFRALDCIDAIRLSGIDASAWYIEEARAAMEQGEILFAGKYSTPDYELILSEQCTLAIESTMIYHTPEVKEQLENTGIPVLVEYSSYETHPLGRMEWMKLYGALLNREREAEDYFNAQQSLLQQLKPPESGKKTVAFFYVTSNGSVNVRKSKDYVAQMLEMAGGDYVFSELAAEENVLSTETIQMEAFYAAAKDADILIYNSAIDKELLMLDELVAKSSLFADFKAVKNKNVWCTGKNMFQQSTGLCDLILDFYNVLTDEDVGDEDLTYLYRLR